MLYKFIPVTFSVATVSTLTVVSWVVAFVALGILQNKRIADNERIIDESLVFGTSKIRNAFEAYFATALSMRRFATASCFEAANVSRSLHQRKKVLPRFEQFARHLDAVSPGATGYYVVPGAVVSQLYPPSAADFYPLGLDVLAEYGEAAAFSTMNTNQLVLTFPLLVLGQWGMVIRAPVHVNSTGQVTVNASTWWGDVNLVVVIKNFLAAIKLERSIAESLYFGLEAPQNGTQLLLYTNDGRGGSSVKRSSLHGNTTVTLALWMRQENNLFTTDNIALVVIIPPIVITVLVLIFNGLYTFTTRVYVGLTHAPKLAPFAVCTVGFFKCEELWNTLPHEMFQYSDFLAAAVLQESQSNQGYPSSLNFQRSHLIATRSADSAVNIGLGIMQRFLEHQERTARSGAAAELDSKPHAGNHTPPPPSRREHDLPMIFTEDELQDGSTERRERANSSDAAIARQPTAVQLCCTIHWCEKAEVTYDEEDGRLHFDGPDIIFSNRLYARTRGNVVILSRAAKNASSKFRGVKFDPFGSVRMRGSDMPHEIFAAVNPRSDLIVKAAESALLAHTQQLQQKRMMRPPGALGGSGHSMMSVVNTRSHNPLYHNNPRAMRIGDDIGLMANSVASSTRPRRSSEYNQKSDHGSSSSIGSLLRPKIADWLVAEMSKIFEPLSTFNAVEFDDIKYMVYHYYCALQVLFRPLAAAEKMNMQRRLITAFGVPQMNFVEHLAVRCALRYIAEQNAFQCETGTTSDSSQN